MSVSENKTPSSPFRLVFCARLCRLRSSGGAVAGHEKQQRGCSNPGAKQAAPTTLAHPLQAAGSEAGEGFDPTAPGRRPSLLVGETSRVGGLILSLCCAVPR